MHPLSAHEILHVWELGQKQHPVGRALTMLAAACPDMARDKLAFLSIGQRDAYLLALREQTFGAILNSFIECPQCRGHMEFTVNIADIRAANHSGEEVHELSIEGHNLRFHLPNSLDLAAIINCKNTAEARSLLIQRCLLQANQNGATIFSGELSGEITDKLISYMVECDPQAEVLLNLECPECGHSWQVMFDILSFLWAEICAQAKRLLLEVNTLAAAYGWREADILSMSAVRRQFYLEMVS